MFPVLIADCIAYLEEVNPLGLEDIELGGPHTSIAGTESPMSSWAVHTDEHSIVEGDP